MAKNADPGALASARFWLALLQHDYDGAEQVLASGAVPEVDLEGFGLFVPRELREALVAHGLGDQQNAKTKFLAARERAAANVQAQPESGQSLMTLAQIDAGLGRKEDAIAKANAPRNCFRCKRTPLLAPNS